MVIGSCCRKCLMYMYLNYMVYSYNYKPHAMSLSVAVLQGGVSWACSSPWEQTQSHLLLDNQSTSHSSLPPNLKPQFLLLEDWLVGFPLTPIIPTEVQHKLLLILISETIINYSRYIYFSHVGQDSGNRWSVCTGPHALQSDGLCLLSIHSSGPHLASPACY